MNDLLKFRSATVRIVGIYALVGCLWIYTSDTVLGWFVQDPHIMVKIAIYKGSFYIIFTSLLLYFLINHYNRNLAVSEQALKDQLKSLLESDTARKLSEAALHESEHKFRSIFGRSPIAIGIGDVQSGTMIEVNDAWLRLFGYVRDEVIGHTTKELNIYINSGERDELIRMVKAQGSIVNHPIKLRHKSGEVMEILYSADLITVGSEPYLQVMMTNNTDLMRAEEALKESEYRWKYALEGAGDGLWDWNLQTGEAYFSSCYKDMLGFAEDEFGSTSEAWLNRLHPDDAPGVIAALQPYLDGKPGSAEVEFRMLCKDGSWRSILGRGAVITRGSDGKPLRMIGTNSDISYRKKLERERLELEQQLLQSQKLESLGVLSGGIAHDFNNILAIIMGYCSLTKMDYETTENNILEIEKAAERAAGLCRQMLAYAGKAQLAKTQVNMWMLVDEIINMLKATLPQNAVINPDLSTNIPFITADASQIRQVVMNLIINASEAIGKVPGEIDVSLAKTTILAASSEKDFNGKIIPPAKYVCLEVRDTGCGMDEETKWRIFEPFYTTKFVGRGLGMSAVLGIIKSHDGALQLFSQLGQGTTFKVYLPVPLKDSTGDENASDIPSAPWRGSGTILLVEDEDQVRLIAKALLNNFGFTVLEAVNGKEALELYLENAADILLVLTDMGMPVMDGYELFHELRKLNSELPIIVSSGYGDLEVSSRMGSDNISGIISKPYNSDQLREVLKRALDGI